MSDLEVKMKDVAHYWGHKMPMMAMEECAELIQAISKFERATIPNNESEEYKNLVKEIADVYISMNALISWYAPGAFYGQMKDDIMEAVENKLNKKY